MTIGELTPPQREARTLMMTSLMSLISTNGRTVSTRGVTLSYIYTDMRLCNACDKKS